MKQSDVTDRDFTDALQMGLRGDIDFKSAQLLFDAASRRSRRTELFSTASRIRDKNLGRRLLLSAHIHMITDCEVSLSCLYCSLSSSERAVNRERARLTMRELGQGVKLAVEKGVQSIVLVGGTNLNGLDSHVRRAVEKARDITDVDLAIDVGPSLSRETIGWLKDKKVSTVYCSIETANVKAFAEAKPGDSLEARVRFMKMVESEGVKLGNVVNERSRQHIRPPQIHLVLEALQDSVPPVHLDLSLRWGNTMGPEASSFDSNFV